VSKEAVKDELVGLALEATTKAFHGGWDAAMNLVEKLAAYPEIASMDGQAALKFCLEAMRDVKTSSKV